MQAALGPDWLVIEEGLSGRTTVSDDPIEGELRNGRRYLAPCLLSHRPLDATILMLGTNDLKVRFAKPASEIAMGVRVLIEDIKSLDVGRNGRSPEILLVSPPPIREDLRGWEPVFAGGYQKSLELAREYESVADATEVHFFDAGSVVSSTADDGFHLDLEGHAILGRAMCEQIENIGWAPLVDRTGHPRDADNPVDLVRKD
jgi:lysophospholipase L1-like esterase